MKTRFLALLLAVLACAVLSAAPVNDDFANALVLAGPAGTNTGSGNGGATKQAGEDSCVNAAYTNTVWWIWTAPANGVFAISTLGSRNMSGTEWDACVAIYTGSSVSTTTKFGEQDSGLEELFTFSGAKAGVQYYLQFAGYDSAVASNIYLTYSFIPMDEPVTNGWAAIPIASGITALDSLRSWLVPDHQNKLLVASRWDNSEFTAHSLSFSGATNPASTGAAWTSIAAPPGSLQNGADNGTAGIAAQGQIYACAAFGAASADRKYVRLNTTGGTWQVSTKVGDEIGAGWAGAYAIIAEPASTGTFIYGQWCGTRNYQSYLCSNEANFAYYALALSPNTPSYWGVDAVRGTDGSMYYYSQGITGGSNMLRRAALSGNVPAAICTPWVNARGELNNDQNAKTGAAIEFVPAVCAPSYRDELWVMPCRVVQSGTPLPYNKIDRYAAADGGYLGSVDLPFVVANDGRGYDLAYLNGYIFVMEGATGMKLWRYKLGDAVSISAARQQGMSASVTIGPITVSTTNDITASGYAFAAQDADAGLTIYGSGATTTYVTNLLNQGVKPGDQVVLQGSNAWYRGLYELMRPTLVTNLGPVGVPAAAPITMNDLQNGALVGKTLQSMHVIISNVFVATSSAIFGTGNYILTNLAGQAATLRIQDAADPLVGTPVPTRACWISGILSQFTSNNIPGYTSTDGYQFMPLRIAVITNPAPPIGWCNLQWPYTLTVVTTNGPGVSDKIYGQIWIDGVTSNAGPTPGLLAWVGYGPSNALPNAPAWTWTPADFNVQVGNNDEFYTNLTIDVSVPVGEYAYCYYYEYQTNDVPSTGYGQKDGGPRTLATYNPAQSGVLTVVPEPALLLGLLAGAFVLLRRRC